jgi:hypothetical protein
MTLAIHILKKDVRHLRLLLVAWLGILVNPSWRRLLSLPQATSEYVCRFSLRASSLLHLSCCWR